MKRYYRTARRLAALLILAVLACTSESNVTEPGETPVASVSLSPESATLFPDEVIRLAAVVKGADGQPLSGRRITWSSSNPGVATIATNGLVTALGNGTTRITAASEGKQATSVVDVVPFPVAYVVLSEQVVNLPWNGTKSLIARAYDVQGREILGKSPTWTTTESGVVVVSDQGVIAARGEGTATVLATIDGRSDGAVVHVAQEPPTQDLIYDRPMAGLGAEIFLLDLVSGAAPVKLNAGNVSSMPSPSPDGRRIAFAVSQPHPQNGRWMEDLFLVDRNGMHLEHFTTADGVETDPAWSPDGLKIAFTATDPVTFSYDIFVMNVDGTGLVNLTAAMGTSNQELHPAWSRDGQFIAFTSIPATGGGGTIWLMRRDGSERRELTNAQGHDTRPTWSPNGQQIAIERFDGNVDIVILDLTGAVVRRIALPGNQHQPAWAPDGKFIAYAHRDTPAAVPQIYTVRPDGTGVRLRTTDPAWGGGQNPSWIVR